MSFLVLWGCNKINDQSDCLKFTASYSSAYLANSTISSKVTAESELKSLATKHHQHTCNRPEGGTSCATSEGANTDDSTHTNSKGIVTILLIRGSIIQYHIRMDGLILKLYKKDSTTIMEDNILIAITYQKLLLFLIAVKSLPMVL